RWAVVFDLLQPTEGYQSAGQQPALVLPVNDLHALFTQQTPAETSQATHLAYNPYQDGSMASRHSADAVGCGKGEVSNDGYSRVGPDSGAAWRRRVRDERTLVCTRRGPHSLVDRFFCRRDSRGTEALVLLVVSEPAR